MDAERNSRNTGEGAENLLDNQANEGSASESSNSSLLTPHSSLHLRDAVASDKEPILEFCHQTWDWGDYIEFVWDDWFNDPRGGLRVGEVNGKPVGVNKLTMLTPAEGWMEGMRLNPAYRGRGYAHEFMADMVQLAEAKGAAVIRLATGSSNAPIQRVAMRLGLRKVAEFTPYNADGVSLEALEADTRIEISNPVRQRLHQFYILEPADAAVIWQHIEASPLRSVAHLYANGWAWSELKPDKLLRHLRDHQVIAHLAAPALPPRRPYLPSLAGADENADQSLAKDASVPAGAIQSLAIITGVDSDSGLEAGYVDHAAQADGGDDYEIEALALALRLSASSLSPACVSLMLPNEASLELSFERAGFSRDMEEGYTMFVYERELKAEG
jgi:RimJ/RimL family protein N-acetyltransferase